MKVKTLLVITMFCISAFTLDAQRFDAAEISQTCVSYLPIAANMGLSFTGVEAKHTFFERGIETSIGFASEVVLVRFILKNLFPEERPDGSDFKSFPSGHTASAFLGSELVRKEYGNGWGAAAYGTSALVSIGRVAHNRHYWWDVAAGAACGYLCANIGYALREPVKNLLGIGNKWDNITFYPYLDSNEDIVCARFGILF